MTGADNDAWLASVRRQVDATKIAVTSNAKVGTEQERVELASALEGIYKRCRSMLEPQP